MFKILLSFLPWILYFIIVGKTREQHQVAIIVALASTVLLDFNTLKKGFLLTWCTLIFFGSLLIATIFVTSNWPENNANFLANSALTFIAWFSLAINKPFTLQYAREEVPEEFWEMPGFLFVNKIITLVWAISFLVMTAISAYQSLFIPWVYPIISYIPTIIAIWFTKVFPDWYQGYCFRTLSRDKENIAENPYLQGNFAPIKTEIDAENLEIEGALPEHLNGTYLRNGPNPMFDPISYTYPIDGDGMLHAIYIQSGKATYRNRWVETKGLVAEKKAGQALYGGIRKPIPTDPKLIGKDGDPGPIKDGAFIHVIRHAQRIFAMYEQGMAYEVTQELKTIGPWCPDGATSPFNVNAHTRYDSRTQELFAFTYGLQPPYLRYYALNSEGILIKNIPVDKSHSSMMHDFVLTENYLVFFDCPAIFDLNAMKTGGNMLSWKPELGVKIILVHRKTDALISIETETFFVYHFANAFEKDNHIIVDYVRHEKLFLGSNSEPKRQPNLYRAHINIQNKSVKHTQLDDHTVEFPRINDALHAEVHHFVYAPTRTISDKNTTFNALIKYDTEKQAMAVHDFGKSIEIGEPIYIPKENSKNEDEGFVGVYTYNAETQNSEFVLLNAESFEDKPLARIKMPQRVPHGLHGSWMPQ